MRSEKGITLVALIGIFVLIVILAGISISIAAKGSKEVQNPANDMVTNIDEEYEDEAIVVDPTAKFSTDVENLANTVSSEVE